MGWSLMHDVSGGGIVVPGRMACEWEDLPDVSHLTCRYSHRCWRESQRWCRGAEEEQAKDRDERKRGKRAKKREPDEGL